jgi:hypothetical protein
MMVPTPTAKLYYLPAAEPVQAPPPPSRWTLLRRRLLRGVWRARLSLSDVHFGRRQRDDDYTALLDSVLGDSRAELIERRPRRPSRPATVLDFQAARLRLRPQAN